MTEVELHIYIKKDGRIILTPAGIKLLSAISETGSLLKASGTMEISYNKAWNMMESLNQSAEKPVVEKVRGGKGGGGMCLTQFGKYILNEYKAIEQQVKNFTHKLNTEINL